MGHTHQTTHLWQIQTPNRREHPDLGHVSEGDRLHSQYESREYRRCILHYEDSGEKPPCCRAKKTKYLDSCI